MLQLQKEGSSCREFVMQKCFTKGWARGTCFPLLSLEAEGRHVVCLEFQECCSHSLSPGTPLLISEMTRIGLNSIFSPLLCCLSSQMGEV